VAGFLQQCDLVKFADLTPTLAECERALADAEFVVRATMPVHAVAMPPPGTATPPPPEEAHP
jgi:hypothetical protein